MHHTAAAPWAAGTARIHPSIHPSMQPASQLPPSPPAQRPRTPARPPPHATHFLFCSSFQACRSASLARYAAVTNFSLSPNKWSSGGVGVRGGGAGTRRCGDGKA